MSTHVPSLEELKITALESEVTYLWALKEDLELKIKNQMKVLQFKDQLESELRKEIAYMRQESKDLSAKTAACNHLVLLFQSLMTRGYILNSGPIRTEFSQYVWSQNHFEAIKLLRKHNAWGLGLAECKGLYEATFMREETQAPPPPVKRPGQFEVGDEVKRG